MLDESSKVKLFRDRFFGRQDVYGRKWSVQNADGVKSGYAPVCDNHWKDNCHRKLKDGVQCGQCTHRRWAPVTDEAVLKHIKGEEQHIYYVLHTTGTIRFGAIDFDMKPGKEDIGYSFEDVRKASNLISSYGIPHYIARSTTFGYHLYFFFSEFYSANKFRCFIAEIFERLGFMEEMRRSGKPIPEFFPKQSYAGRDGIGNGIKPPMIEAQFPKGRNCWVSVDDKVIEDQWGYLASMVTINPEMFDGMLAKEDIEIIEDRSAPGERSLPGMGRERNGNHQKWQPPLKGSIEKVLEGCAAFRRLKEKVTAGVVLGHSEGFALYHMCMHTLDGIDWFKANVKGWGESGGDLRQLEHSIDKSYLPWTCKKLQESGICIPGTQCFEKKPPREIVDGLEVYRDDLPRDKWPEPSPIRYAHGKGEDCLLKLQKEAEDLKDVTDTTQVTTKLKDIARRVQVFDGGQQKEFKTFVKGLKVVKANEVAKIFNTASTDHEEHVKKQIIARDDSSSFDDHFYMRSDPSGYFYMKSMSDGKTKTIKLCSYDINITEERSYLDDGRILKSMYSGTVKMPGFEKGFEIDVDEWNDNSKFVTYFGKLIGHNFSPLRQNLEYIRQAALAFSKKSTIERKAFLMTQGYYGDTYLMPTCVIDSTGVRPNTTSFVDLKFKETRNLDFKILEVEELKSTLRHLKTEFFTCWPELWTYTGIAHTLMPAVMAPMGWTKRTTLFYEGLTGGGKSELTHALQYFWGKFESIANFFSSAKGIRELGYQFKDACVVVDDYKGLSREQVSAVKECILRSYDGTAEYKLTVNSEMRVPKATRGIYMMSGEEFITSDAATVARTVLVVTTKHNTQETQYKYASVRQNRGNYCGITPVFISWFLAQDRKACEERFESIRLRLKDGNHSAQNIDRISTNLAMNYVTWELLTGFMISVGVLSEFEKEVMDDKHWGHILMMRSDMVERCAAEQSSEIFLEVLRELIHTGEVSIDSLQGFMNPNKKTIGFIPKDTVEVVCLFPKTVFEVVKSFCHNQPITGTDKAIIRQLDDQGAVAMKDSNRLTKLVRYKGSQQRVWALKMTSLNLGSAAHSDERGKVIPLRG